MAKKPKPTGVDEVRKVIVNLRSKGLPVESQRRQLNDYRRIHQPLDREALNLLNQRIAECTR
jgi:biotin operon repressor